MKRMLCGGLAIGVCVCWVTACGSSKSAQKSGTDAIATDDASNADSVGDLTSDALDATHLDADEADEGRDTTGSTSDGEVTDADSSTPDASTKDGAVASGAHIAVPMYVDPSESPSLWTQVIGAGGVVGLLVANLDNGPGTVVDSEYTAAITNAHGTGEIVIGYVHTSSAGRVIADVEADVDSWYSLYPNLDGIFVDEVSSDPSTVASYYLPLYTYIKAKRTSVTVAINPGTMVDQSFMTASDILVTYEDTYANYIDVAMNPPNPAWVATYPASRFWTLILSADAGVEANAIGLARGRNAGWIYVTAEGPDTAYQNIETGTYWSTELTDVSAP